MLAQMIERKKRSIGVNSRMCCPFLGRGDTQRFGTSSNANARFGTQVPEESWEVDPRRSPWTE
jgi:hypothetical protein